MIANINRNRKQLQGHITKTWDAIMDQFETFCEYGAVHLLTTGYEKETDLDIMQTEYLVATETDYTELLKEDLVDFADYLDDVLANIDEMIEEHLADMAYLYGEETETEEATEETETEEATEETEETEETETEETETETAATEQATETEETETTTEETTEEATETETETTKQVEQVPVPGHLAEVPTDSLENFTDLLRLSYRPEYASVLRACEAELARREAPSECEAEEHSLPWSAYLDERIAEELKSMHGGESSDDWREHVDVVYDRSTVEESIAEGKAELQALLSGADDATREDLDRWSEVYARRYSTAGTDQERYWWSRCFWVARALAFVDAM